MTLRLYVVYLLQTFGTNFEMEHTKHCALLNSTVELLTCGLESTLLTVMHQFKDDVSSYDFTRIVAAAIFSQSKQVLQSIKRLMGLHCGQDNPKVHLTSCYDSAFVNNSYSLEGLSQLHNCYIQQDSSSGRKLTACQGVGMGSIMLQETPYICVLCSRCGCREQNLLLEHIDMAAKLLVVGHNNVRNLHTFMGNFCTGLPHIACGIKSEEYASQILWKQTKCWSFHMQCVMTLVSVLYALYEHHESVEQVEDFSSIELSVKVQIISKAHQLFQILVRLPLNCHAITTVIESSQSSSSIESRRIAYAAFLSASSVNHSCDPNAIVRYQWSRSSQDHQRHQPTASTQNSITAQQVAHSMSIEIVATRSILRDDEIAISYGLLASKQRLSRRQQSLQEQYLFQCRCSACERELSQEHETKKNVISMKQQQLQQQPSIDQEESMRWLGAIQDMLTQTNTQLSDVFHLSKAMQPEALQMIEGKLVSSVLVSLQRLALTSEQHTLHHPLSLLWTELHRQYESYQRASQMSRGKKKQAPVVLPTIEQSSQLDIYLQHKSFFLEYCGLYCLYLDLHSYCSGLLQQYPKACEMLEYMIFIMLYSRRFTSEDPEIARERIKLASLCSNGGNWKDGYHYANEGYQILRKLVAFNDPDVIEAENILNYVRNALQHGK